MCKSNKIRPSTCVTEKHCCLCHTYPEVTILQAFVFGFFAQYQFFILQQQSTDEVIYFDIQLCQRKSSVYPASTFSK